ncbi:hypothetical protein AB9H29_12105 [Stenotrophomonas sepilia]|uniref:hypothetical protein n=1 Tax=Stenotrophomonas sepilia TaxID=2860290 RepID=UPI0035585E14
MNKDNAKDYLPLVQALAEGRVIEHRGSGGWYQLNNPTFQDQPSDYRIKPEPREIWVNEWDGNGFVVFATEREAKEHANRYGIGHVTTRYREVIE